MYIQIFSDASYNKLINRETNELLTVAGYSFVVYHSDSLDRKTLSNNQIIHSEIKNLTGDSHITDNTVMNTAFLEATALLNALEYARDNYLNDLSFVFYCDSKFICDQVKTKTHQIKTLSKNNNKRINDITKACKRVLKDLPNARLEWIFGYENRADTILKNKLYDGIKRSVYTSLLEHNPSRKGKLTNADNLC